MWKELVIGRGGIELLVALRVAGQTKKWSQTGVPDTQEGIVTQ